MPHNLIHRGLAKKKLKENTLQAFRYCFKKKFGIETDLHVTKDGKIICFHDFNLKRKFKINKLIKNLSFNEINKIAKKFGRTNPEKLRTKNTKNRPNKNSDDKNKSEKQCSKFWPADCLFVILISKSHAPKNKKEELK